MIRAGLSIHYLDLYKILQKANYSKVWSCGPFEFVFGHCESTEFGLLASIPLLSPFFFLILFICEYKICTQTQISIATKNGQKKSFMLDFTEDRYSPIEFKSHRMTFEVATPLPQP